MTEKVMIFVDGSNLFRSLRQYHPKKKICYKKLKDILVDGRNLINAYYFGSRPIPPIESQEGFYTALGELGYTLEIVNLKYYPDGSRKEKGVDVSLAIEMLVHAFNKNYDVGVLVAGDEDYLRLITEVKRLGIKVEIVSFRGSLSKKLKSCGAMIYYLDDMMIKIEE